MKTSNKIKFGALLGAILASSAFIPAMSFADDAKSEAAKPPVPPKKMPPRFHGHNTKGLFDRMDTNKDGVITKEEVKAAHDAMFTAIDKNHDGVITREEIKEYHKAQQEIAQEKANQARAKYFDSIDKNNDGFITKDEWVSTRLGKNPDAAKRREASFAKFDKDNDGKITRAEFDAIRKPPMGGQAGPRPPMMHDGKMKPPINKKGAFKDGKITKAEWDAMPMPLFDVADTNKDGKITKEEAAHAMKNMRNRPPLAPQQK